MKNQTPLDDGQIVKSDSKVCKSDFLAMDRAYIKFTENGGIGF
jgi:hypothetical protein